MCDDGIHLYSCIEKWLKKAQPLGKCPQCNLKARRKDIRVIYAKSVSVVDTTERDRALKKGKPVGACVCVPMYMHVDCNVMCLRVGTYVESWLHREGLKHEHCVVLDSCIHCCQQDLFTLASRECLTNLLQCVSTRG